MKAQKILRWLLPVVLALAGVISVLSIFNKPAQARPIILAVPDQEARLAAAMAALPRPALSLVKAGATNQASQAFSSLPLRFIPNQGQADPAVRFMVKGAGHSLFFTEEEVVFSAATLETKDDRRKTKEIEQPASISRGRSSVVRLRFLGANPQARIEGRSPLGGVVNYFLGDDPARWQTNLPTYEALAYRNLYPGIDLVYRGTQGRLKSEFHVSPGADPALIRMTYRGVKSARLRPDGALVLQTAIGELVEGVPLIYQEFGDEVEVISGGYTLTPIPSPRQGMREHGKGYMVSFWLSSYDPALPLVIDPELAFSSYLGGDAKDDGGLSITLDSTGNIYIVGYTTSDDFPTLNPIDPYCGGGQGCSIHSDVFVTKLSQSNGGYSYAFSTFLGGAGTDSGYDIATDSAGNIYVTGVTGSIDFPVYKEIQSTNQGYWDAFVTKLNRSGNLYSYGISTYLGGNYSDQGNGIGLDSAGNFYVTGFTDSTNFPTHKALQANPPGNDAFVTMIVQAGSVYTYGYSTYLGGSADESTNDIAVTPDGKIFVIGSTTSNNFPTHKPIQTNPGADDDAFVTEIISAGGVITYAFSTYLGGTGQDNGWGIALDKDGNVYVTGLTLSSDFPVRDPIQSSKRGFADAFVTQIISESGVYTYSFSTYLGGSGSAFESDSGTGIAVDDMKNIYVIGSTNTNDFPTYNALDASLGGSSDAFVTELALVNGVYIYVFSTYLGGSGPDGPGRTIALDGKGYAYVTGNTYSSDFPTHNAIDSTLGGTTDAFVTKFGTNSLGIYKSAAPSFVERGKVVTYTLAYANENYVTAYEVMITDIVPVTLTNLNVTSSGAQITPTGGLNYVWNVAPLPPGSGGNITITGIINPAATGLFTLTNQATITSTDPTFLDKISDDNLSTAKITVGEAIAGLNASNDGPTLLGEQTTLTATITTGSLVSYAWNFGDGETGAGRVVTHVYPDVGSYTAVVTATNPLGWASDITSVDVYQNCIVRLNDIPTIYNSVQAAVDASSSASDVVKVAGTCSGVNVRGGLSQTVYLSKTLTIQGGYTITNWTTPDPVANPTTLDAQGDGRVLYITGGITATIKGLRITGGDAAGLGGGPPEADAGGGISVNTADLNMSNCQVFSNTVQGVGGGIDLYHSTATLFNNTIMSNTVEFDTPADAGEGGGVKSYEAKVTLTNNTFRGNTAGGDGGGVDMGRTDAILSGNTFVANHAYGGGGVNLSESYGVTLNANTILSNTAEEDAGGLRLSNTTVTVEGNVISGNTANYNGGGGQISGSTGIFKGNSITHNNAGYDGGGLRLDESPLTLADNLIANNTASMDGGGLFLSQCGATLTNNVVIDNQAGVDDRGGGIFAQGDDSILIHNTLARNSGGASGIYIAMDDAIASRLVLTNTILVSHSVGITITNGNTATINGILWDASTPITISKGTTAIVSIQNQHTGDPAFATDGYHLTMASTAIDAGVPSGVETDIDDQLRPMNDGYDLGADEFPEVMPLSGSGSTVTPDGVLTFTYLLAEPITITYAAQVTTTYDTGDFQFGGMVFHLEAFDLNGDPVITPTTPLTLTLHYNEADLPVGVPESFFDVYWYDPSGGIWNPLPVVSLDLVHNYLTVLLNHFSEFALLAEEPRWVYLPLLRR